MTIYYVDWENREDESKRKEELKKKKEEDKKAKKEKRKNKGKGGVAEKEEDEDEEAVLLDSNVVEDRKGKPLINCRWQQKIKNSYVRQ